MRVLGIDPGLRELGWAVLESSKKKNNKSKKYKLISYGLITTSDKKDISQRLFQIGQEIKMILRKFKPDVCAMESVFVWKDPSAALKLGMVLGTCFEISNSRKIKVRVLSPLFVKSKISGDRYADKNKLGKFVQKKIILNGKTNGFIKELPHHITDAMAIAISSFYCK